MAAELNRGNLTKAELQEFIKMQNDKARKRGVEPWPSREVTRKYGPRSTEKPQQRDK